ncbi:MAG: hypothetical protein KGV46_00690 [Pasteurella sp.]|nr:hypothetical protein [Pasteurella sp.]
MNYRITIDKYTWEITGRIVWNNDYSKNSIISVPAQKLMEFLFQQELREGVLKQYSETELGNIIDTENIQIVRNAKTNFANALRKVYGLSKKNLPAEVIFDTSTVPSKSSKTTTFIKFPHQVSYLQDREITKEKRQAALAEVELEKKSNNKTTQIINALLRAFPKHKKAIFQTDEGHMLPFTTVNKNCSPPFKFPLEIDALQSKPHRVGLDSLYEIRKNAGANLYPGKILQLKKDDKGYKLGHTIYTHILDSCDNVGSTLKRAWSKLDEQNMSFAERQQKIKEISSDIGAMAFIWSQRLNQVKQEDFSDYLAGLAFSLPMFHIQESGLSLVCAEGSALKASGSGQKHICPAGMLEIFNSKIDKNFTIADFRAVASKELLEETLFGSKFKLKNSSIYSQYVRNFSTELAGQVEASYPMLNVCVEDLLKIWDDLWEDFEGWHKSTPPSNEAIMQVQQLSMEKAPWFFIIDIMNFRPEIIKPLYLRNSFDCFLNWEYKNNYSVPEIISWKDQYELEDWVRDNHKDWCTPGIASAYLGARYYFNNKEKF